MHRDEVLKSIDELKSFVKERRDNDLQYNKVEREKMIDIIRAPLTDKLMVMEVVFNEGVKDLEKQIQTFHEGLIKDMNDFDDKLKDMETLFDIDTFIRKINRLTEKERLHEDRIISVEGRMESMSIALRNLEERH